MVKADDEWARRILCSDGNCIGVVGTDGLCKACGKPYEGELPLPVDDAGMPGDGLEEKPADHQAAEENNLVDDDPAASNDAAGDSWESRTLCIDQNCIGVVGPDGRCKECGKPYPGYQS